MGRSIQQLSELLTRPGEANNTGAFWERANLYFERGKYEEAKKDLLKLAALMPPFMLGPGSDYHTLKVKVESASSLTGISVGRSGPIMPPPAAVASMSSTRPLSSSNISGPIEPPPELAVDYPQIAGPLGLSPGKRQARWPLIQSKLNALGKFRSLCPEYRDDKYSKFNFDQVKAVISGGLFRRALDMNLITTEPYQGWEYSYILISMNNIIYIPQLDFVGGGSLNHSSFVHGERVLFAGEVRIKNGTMLEITARSGHYRPTRHNMVQALSFLQNKEVDLSKVGSSQLCAEEYSKKIKSV